ncbi:MAG TPA: hypothetical protein VH394_28320 [Thermoanaerobaculia bacterium]|jgi:hypothetical protein|nr:hypothetical protein [Thermoanaerobaculia bacterium]
MAIPERKPLSVEDEVRALLEEGRISDAKKLVEAAGDQLPESLREIFAPPRIRRVGERGVDRTPEFNWLKANGPAYAGKWVALVGDDLVGCEDVLEELLAKLDQRKFDRRPLLHHLV